MMKPLSEMTILDHGKVSLLQTMGSDQDILDAARISYNSNSVKQYNEAKDRGLIRYMMKHRHTSAFEMCETKFYLKIPIFVMRQLVRHRTANINEVSGRYSELPEEMYIPELEQLGPQSTKNNQGRSPMIDIIGAKKSKQNIQLSSHNSFEAYDRLLQSDVSREISRIVLPLNTYTELVWKCDLHNFLHFTKLRTDLHAQYEIRVMAQAMYDLVKPHFPLSCEAFEDYILYAHTLSRLDMKLLSLVMQGQTPTLDTAKGIGMSEREFKEFTTWLSTL
jgi:thymidylate synthase (FAD)